MILVTGCVFVFIKLHITAQSGPVIQVILCHSRVCFVIPFGWASGLWTHQPGPQEEQGHTGFLQLPSAVLALMFISRRIQPSPRAVPNENDYFEIRNL